MSLDLIEPRKHAEKSPGSMAFAIKGSKGSGVLLISQAPGGDGTQVGTAELVLPSGEVIPLASLNDHSAGLEEMAPEEISADGIQIQLNEFVTPTEPENAK
jgi:hypothetical protein